MRRDQPSRRGASRSSGSLLTWLGDAVRQIRLAWRLLRDQRVPAWTKLVPPAAVAYVLSPIDILSDLPPMGLNQLDDVAVILLGVKLFIELAPPEVTREHLQALGAHVEEWRVVEGEYEIEEPEERRSEADER